MRGELNLNLMGLLIYIINLKFSRHLHINLQTFKLVKSEIKFMYQKALFMRKSKINQCKYFLEAKLVKLYAKCKIIKKFNLILCTVKISEEEMYNFFYILITYEIWEYTFFVELKNIPFWNFFTSVIRKIWFDKIWWVFLIGST